MEEKKSFYEFLLAQRVEPKGVQTQHHNVISHRDRILTWIIANSVNVTVVFFSYKIVASALGLPSASLLLITAGYFLVKTLLRGFLSYQ